MAKQKVKTTRIAKLRNTFSDGKARSLAQLARDTGATPNTLNQYIRTLRLEGFPIVSERGTHGEPTKYRLVGRKGRSKP